MAEESVSPAGLVEMLRRELDASKSVSEHLSFLRQLAQDPASTPLKESLIAHIGDEEAEHQAHLARLLPAIEAYVSKLSGAKSATAPAAAPSNGSGFTVGGLTDKRPWFVGQE